MNSEILKEFENKKVKVVLRNQRILQGYLTLQGRVAIIIKDSKKHAILSQEITQVEEID